jgi:hypothetical protein
MVFSIACAVILAREYSNQQSIPVCGNRELNYRQHFRLRDARLTCFRHSRLTFCKFLPVPRKTGSESVQHRRQHNLLTVFLTSLL